MDSRKETEDVTRDEVTECEFCILMQRQWIQLESEYPCEIHDYVLWIVRKLNRNHNTLTATDNVDFVDCCVSCNERINMDCFGCELDRNLLN